MYVIPDDEVRKIKHLRVFLVTATWSVFAYIWLYVILGFISYGKVETWEGLLTFIFFPLTVWTAYVAAAACSATSGSANRRRRASLLWAARLTSRPVVLRSSRNSTRILTLLWLNLRRTVASTSLP